MLGRVEAHAAFEGLNVAAHGTTEPILLPSTIAGQAPFCFHELVSARSMMGPLSRKSLESFGLFWRTGGANLHHSRDLEGSIGRLSFSCSF